MPLRFLSASVCAFSPPLPSLLSPPLHWGGCVLAAIARVAPTSLAFVHTTRPLWLLSSHSFCTLLAQPRSILSLVSTTHTAKADVLKRQHGRHSREHKPTHAARCFEGEACSCSLAIASSDFACSKMAIRVLFRCDNSCVIVSYLSCTMCLPFVVPWCSRLCVLE